RAGRDASQPTIAPKSNPRISVMAMVRTSMDMSIARFAALSRHHERQPRLGKLQLRGVDRGVDHARLHGRREPVRAKAVANRLQRAARFDLRVAPLVRVLARALARHRTRARATHLQAVQPRTLHPLE